MATQTHTQAQNPSAFLTPAQLAERWQVTQMTLRRWRAAGKLKASHFGRAIRFSAEEIARIEQSSVA